MSQVSKLAWSIATCFAAHCSRPVRAGGLSRSQPRAASSV